MAGRFNLFVFLGPRFLERRLGAGIQNDAVSPTDIGVIEEWYVDRLIASTRKLFYPVATQLRDVRSVDNWGEPYEKPRLVVAPPRKPHRTLSRQAAPRGLCPS